MENLNAVKAKYAPKRSFFSHPSMLTKAALAAIDNNVNSDRSQVSIVSLVCQIISIDYFLSQSCTASGALQFDLVTNRDGSKFFVKPVKVEKDSSWKDAIASVVMQVVLIHMK